LKQIRYRHDQTDEKTTGPVHDTGFILLFKTRFSIKQVHGRDRYGQGRNQGRANAAQKQKQHADGQEPADEHIPLDDTDGFENVRGFIIVPFIRCSRSVKRRPSYAFSLAASSG